ncbi:Na+/H+ antiporter subunit E [Pseudobacteriovorax antillogorgiicola]|nr:Na+/H+ antiporter subunit E [Pseudobacteriovorax antillogorgiicola]
MINKPWLLTKFIGIYCADLFYSACKIAWDVATIRDHSSPGIVKVPLEKQSDPEVTLLANLITFSPGTMVVDLAPDKSFALVHFMFIDTPDEAIATIKTLESRILELLR